MKIQSTTRADGSALIITLLIAFVIGISVASCLALVSNQKYSIMRSQQWNSAIPVAEAGIEEAFSHLNDDAGNLTANGWASSQVNGQTVYTKRRDFTNDGSYCNITISNATVAPVVFSKASVPAALNRGTLTRTLRVTTTMNSGGAAGGILTKNAINLGSDFLIDSYDSTDPNWSTNGRYDTNKVRANGNLASLSTTTNQIMLADSKIYGHLYTPPTGGYSIGSHGRVGDQAFVNDPALTNDAKVEAGYYSNDLNTTIPDVATPSGASSWAAPAYLGDSKKGPTSYTYGGVTYPAPAGSAWQYVLTAGSYNMGSTTLAGNVLVLGDATLYVPSAGRVQFGSGNVISIPVSANSTFKMYNGSTTDAVMKDASNDSGDPHRFSYYGLPSTAGTKLTLTGDGAYAYIGLIYCPEQKVVLTGSSSGNVDFIGAVTCDNFTMSGHTNMHIDESLIKISGGGGGAPVINSYNEIASN